MFQRFCLFLCLTSVLPLAAATLYSQGVAAQIPPVGGQGINSLTAAANFQLATGGTAVAATFYSLACCNQADWSGDLNYYFFTDVGGLPASSPFASGTVSYFNTSTLYTDASTNRVIEYDFNLVTPVALSANTNYWFGLHAANGIALEWNFGSTSSIGEATASGTNFSSWGLTFASPAFQLYDSSFAVPEPSTIGLVLAGGALLGILRRRQSI